MKRKHAILLVALLLVVSFVLPACSAEPAQPQATPAADSIASDPPKQTMAPAPTPSADPTQTPVPIEPLRYENPHKYTVRYTVAIDNIDFAPSDILLYLPLPSQWEAQKDLTIDTMTPQPDSSDTDLASENRMAFWELEGTPEKGDTTEFVIAFSFTAYETLSSIGPEDILPYDTESTEYVRYTQPEAYVESDDPAVVALADMLAGEATDPYLIAQSFYEYILNNTTYALLGMGLNGAKYALEQRQGECGDYSALFIALCRAKGIPARAVVGYWAESGEDKTHVWAEFFLEGIGWIPVDASIGQQSESNRSYYFGNMDNRRVILSKGFNTPLTPETPDAYIAPILQVPLWWYWGSGDAESITMQRTWIVEDAE